MQSWTKHFSLVCFLHMCNRFMDDIYINFWLFLTSFIIQFFVAVVTTFFKKVLFLSISPLRPCWHLTQAFKGLFFAILEKQGHTPSSLWIKRPSVMWQTFAFRHETIFYVRYAPWYSSIQALTLLYCALFLRPKCDFFMRSLLQCIS